MSEAAPPPVQGRLPGLEAQRGFAAICILLLHTNANFGGLPMFGRGYLAVEFFLMLSGFLMAYVQEPRFEQRASFLGYMNKRYRRLWPMMALGGLLGLPRLFALTGDAGQFATTALLNLLLLPVCFGTFAFALNIPAWTIFYELVANSLHIPVYRHLRGWLLAIAIAILGAVMVWIGMTAHSFDVGAKVSNFWMGLPRTTFAYLIGMAMGRVWRNNPPSLPVPPLLTIPAMPVILVAGWKLGLGSWTFDYLFTVIACPLMIMGGFRLKGSNRLAALLGKLSFPLFAIQMPIVEGTRMLGFDRTQGLLSALAGGVLAMLLASAIGRWRSKQWQEKAA